MTMNEAFSRLEKLEKAFSIGGEIEDTRVCDIIIYGVEAIKEIYREDGADSLRNLKVDPQFSGKERDMIERFISRA